MAKNVRQNAELDDYDQEEFISKSWKCFKIDENHVVYKFSAGCDSYRVIVCDGVNAWSENLSKEEIETKHRELNPSIEAPFDVILTQIHKVFTENKTLSIIHKDEEKFYLESDCHIQEMPFSWIFYLLKCPNAMIADHLTFPLLAMMTEQENRIQELCKIIATKDAEITEYKLSGASITRKSTPVFNEHTFREKIYSKLDQLKNNSPMELLTNNERTNRLYHAMNKFCQLKPLEDVSDESPSDLTQETAEIIVNKPDKLPKNNETEIQRRLDLKKRLDEQEIVKAKKKKKVVKL